MADGRLAPTLAQLWLDTPVFWATPEKADGDMISSCSLVGVHTWTSTLAQMGHPFEIVYGDLDEPDTVRALTETVNLISTSRRLKSVRIGIIGGQAPGFFAMSADPFSVHRGVGAQTQTFSLIEFEDVVSSLEEDLVAADVAEVESLGLKHKDISPSKEAPLGLCQKWQSKGSS
jgi:L-fucose isomerase-like protein